VFGPISGRAAVRNDDVGGRCHHRITGQQGKGDSKMPKHADCPATRM
jgi:hypothetical protein